MPRWKLLMSCVTKNLVKSTLVVPGNNQTPLFILQSIFSCISFSSLCFLRLCFISFIRSYRQALDSKDLIRCETRYTSAAPASTCRYAVQSGWNWGCRGEQQQQWGAWCRCWHSHGSNHLGSLLFQGTHLRADSGMARILAASILGAKGENCSICPISAWNCQLNPYPSFSLPVPPTRRRLHKGMWSGLWALRSLDSHTEKPWQVRQGLTVVLLKVSPAQVLNTAM